MHPSAAATILNVNDREPNRCAMSRTLRAAGFHVIEAADGAGALALATTAQPQLIVLDVNLPDMSGLLVARRLKATPTTAHIPVLHVSASSVFAHHKAEGMEGGADGYLTEPFEPNELVATVKALLRLGKGGGSASAASSQWQSMFDAIGDGIALCDAGGTVRVHNEAFGVLFGAKVRSGGNIGAAFEDAGSLTTAIAEASKAGGRRKLEITERRRTFCATLDPVRPHAPGVPRNVVVTLEEVTSQKREEASLKLLSDMGPTLMASLDFEETLKQIAASPVPLFADYCLLDLKDDSGRTLRRVATSNAERDGGLPAELEKLTPDPAHPDLVVERAFFGGEPSVLPRVAEQDLELLTRDPGRRQVLKRLDPSSLLCVPLEVAGKPIGAITLVTNGSDRHYATEDLTLAKQLASRAALAVENARLHREARSAVNTRDEFFSIASHELRNPLAALMLQLKLLQRELQRSPNKPAPLSVLVTKVDAAERNASRIGELVHELLDTTRIRAGKLELKCEPVDFGLLVRDGVKRIEPEAHQAKTEISINTTAKVVGNWDRSRLEQVIANLLTNAVKYGSGQPISVAVAREEGGARLVVHDGGIGVPAEDQERIFEAFERGKALYGSGMTGLGLGLYISRKIVEAHGGKIGLKSVPGEGSTFTVTLPLNPPVKPATTAG